MRGGDDNLDADPRSDSKVPLPESESRQTLCKTLEILMKLSVQILWSEQCQRPTESRNHDNRPGLISMERKVL